MSTAMTTRAPAATPAAPTLHGVSTWPAVLTAVAGGIFLDGSVITAAHRGSSPVPTDMFAFPWQGSTAIATSLMWGLAQAFMVVGLVAFARRGEAWGRVGRFGARLAVAGGVLFTAAHLVSALASSATIDDLGAVVAMSFFGFGTLALAIGLLLAGGAALGGPARSAWARRTPLALGVWMVIMIPLQFTPALAVAVGGYATLVIAFGAALLDRRAVTGG